MSHPVPTPFPIRLFGHTKMSSDQCLYCLDRTRRYGADKAQCRAKRRRRRILGNCWTDNDEERKDKRRIFRHQHASPLRILFLMIVQDNSIPHMRSIQLHPLHSAVGILFSLSSHRRIRIYICRCWWYPPLLSHFLCSTSRVVHIHRLFAALII